MDDWRAMTAAELGRGIGAGRIDPVALAESFLDAAEAHPEGTRIYARLTRGRALSEAVAAHDRAKAGLRRGPLDGVPISWKDLFDTAGIATEAGSALLAGRVPERDAEVLATATLQGTVCLGKTHMTELAFSGLGLNPVTRTPPNIHDRDRVPGGSSSGAAASVAWGLAAAAVASDTGGSVRVPSSWNDLVGLKTTHGRLSLRGVVALCPAFDTVGPIARTVEDAGLLLAALEGGPAADLAGATLTGARLAVLDTLALDGLRDPQGAAFEAALLRLASAGAVIEHVEAPEIAEAMALAAPLFAPEAYALWGEAIEAAPHLMYPPVLARFRGGAAVSAVDHIRAWRRLGDLRAAYGARMAGYDAVLLPTTANTPPAIDRLLADEDYFTAENLLALRNTRIGNLMGGAVLTLPTGTAFAGLSLMGPPMSEERLLRLGSAAERALSA